jgi:hypothetical protein
MGTTGIDTLLTILVGAISVALAFYIKEFLQKRNTYSSLRKKLERIAGKNALVIYNPGAGLGMGPQLFKIANVDNHGVMLENELHTVFVPAAKLIESEMILPCSNYEKARLDKARKDFEEMADTLVPAMVNKMIPQMFNVMREYILEEFVQEEGEFSAVVGIKIQKALEAEGYTIKKIPSKLSGG